MAKQHPAFPPNWQSLGGGPIDAHCLLEADAAISHIKAMHASALNRSTTGRNNKYRALWVAYWALKLDLEQAARDAVAAGQLLFCWHGTQALGNHQEGGAA